MKFNDNITTSIAATVSRVLEGKAPVKKEEVKYPHDMYHPKTGEKEVAKNEADHKALSAKGYTHEKPKVNEVEEPNKPSGKLGQDSGERDFKAKHPIKKVGIKTDLDGTTMNEEVTDLNEDVDQTFGFPTKDKLVKFQSQVKGVKPLGNPTIMKRGGKEYHVMMFKGSVKNIEKAMKVAMSIYDESLSFKESVNEAYNKRKELSRVKKISKLVDQISKEIRNFPDEITDEGTDDTDLAQAFYDMNKGLGDLQYGIGDYEYTLKNLDESVKEGKEMTDEESEKQKKYQAFFQKALKKFGVSSPSELEGDKKKEFFDYVDANYEADKEED